MYVKLGNELEASKIFTVVSLFNALRFPLVMIPLAVKFVAESGVKGLLKSLLTILGRT